MAAYLKQAFSTERLSAEISDTGSEFYFAKHAEHVIGYLKLNMGASQTELTDENALEIERIYVLKSFHGKNAGQLLYEKSLDVALKNNCDYIWLGVWERNPRAISFYRKKGFTAFDMHIFRLGADEQTDIMMKLHLNKVQRA